VCVIIIARTCRDDVARASSQHGELGLRNSRCGATDLSYGGYCVVYEAGVSMPHTSRQCVEWLQRSKLQRAVVGIEEAMAYVQEPPVDWDSAE
jgi:hypothetical protein